MDLPAQLTDLLNLLRKEISIRLLLKKSNVYLIGGCVRDAYLNKSIKDVDIVVEDLTLEEIKHLLRPYGSIKIVGESFAVIKFKPKGWDEDIDIAVPREDIKTGEGHKGFEVNTEGVDIIQDLRRRDITINSIAVNIKTGKIIDPFDGLGDIRKHLIIATNPEAFIDDPLRIMRVIQFASRFNFQIDNGTFGLMKHYAHLITKIPGERILDELNKIINKKGNTELAINLLNKTGLDKYIFGNTIEGIDQQDLNNLDMISFYYLLGLLSNQNPAKLYKGKLRGEFDIAKAIENLGKLLSTFTHYDYYIQNENKNEANLKYNVLISINESPLIKHSVILPDKIKNILKEMNKKEIPSSLKDLSINGDDIMDFLEIKTPNIVVGKIIKRLATDALMKKYNWKNKIKSLEYLESIIKEII
jgi:tRNA nucleotidyltransferase (CCA-adding enzyme)